MPETHERALEALARRDRLRHLTPRGGCDFASNDYLGLANSDVMRAAAADALTRGVAVGAGASRLLRGNDPEHELLERETAEFFGVDGALYFSGGFTANMAVFSTLPSRGDLIVHDALIHASVHEGMRISKADSIGVAHNDATAVDDAISGWRNSGGLGTPWIAVESLYSMEGDRAPLDALMEIANRHDGILIIDEAHATGVYGTDGRGLGYHLDGRHNVISLHTCGKALGAMGALVTLPNVMRDFMINRARAFIYATAPSPLMAALVRSSLKICRDEPERRERLAKLVTLAGQELSKHGIAEPSGSQIQPVIVGQDARAVELANALQARGYDVRAIRPPTVPEGSARLRISLTLNASEADVCGLIGALADEHRRLAA